jgi:hypothetical protein
VLIFRLRSLNVEQPSRLHTAVDVLSRQRNISSKDHPIINPSLTTGPLNHRRAGLSFRASQWTLNRPGKVDITTNDTRSCITVRSTEMGTEETIETMALDKGRAGGVVATSHTRETYFLWLISSTAYASYMAVT